MQNILILLLLVLTTLSDSEFGTMSFDDRANYVDTLFIHYGDTVRIENVLSEYFLHSHSVSYG